MFSAKKCLLAVTIFLLALGSAAVLTTVDCGGGNSMSVSSSVPTGPTPPSTPSVPSTPNNGFFGMTVGLFEKNAAFADRWPTVPIGTLGKMNGTQWNAIEKTPGNYDWTNLDAAVQMAKSNGVVNTIYTFYGVPRFYTVAGAPCPAVGCAGPPANLQNFTNFVTALATRYKGEINYYELWNEGNRSAAWSGTTADFVALAQTAFQTIKSIDPNAKVLSPSASAASDFATFVQGFLQAGGSAYSDGVSFHGYQCQNGNPTGDSCLAGTSCDQNGLDCAGAPLENMIADVRGSQQAAAVANIPLYDTEGGWRQNKDLPSLNDQVAYISRWYVIQASEGVKIATWYFWGGTPTDPDQWGSIYDATTGQPTQAAAAYATTYNWINGATLQGACAADSSNVWTCPLTFSNGKTGLVVWNGNETSSSYTPASQFIQYETLTSTSPASIAGGGTVPIGEAPILLESGNRP
jgi:hypothetical protein